MDKNYWQKMKKIILVAFHKQVLIIIRHMTILPQFIVKRLHESFLERKFACDGKVT